MYWLVDPFIGFVIDRWGVPEDGRHPSWWCHMVDGFFQRWNEQWVKRMMAADEAGVGLTQAWVSPETSAAAILGWFDDTIATAPRGLLGPDQDIVAVFLVDARTEEMEQTPPGATLHLSADRLLTRWEGTRQDWWREGRDGMAQAIPSNHQGLALVVNAVSRIMLPGL